ncbi:hypothetical protein A7985_14670 [Pseudoalteromonas luteoviolacea]|uniref:Glutathionylspermidine synthase pre-ATP-grasp-like domain-containing protein n=1 Tax=Pseudoalteromonas luteoviolacea TaxID=43657 RepID=A0A1C0TQ14_9GAMM|nr:hypothetical protein [Pseudoalteromonas luteoviolacea]OCQ21024.1 hypothetical protein A7985_14670 [Pseudoalteromonas luteoviolacea]
MENLASYNEEWIGSFLANKDYITKRSVLKNMSNFVRKDGAHLVKMVPIPLIMQEQVFNGLAQAADLIVEAQTKILSTLCNEFNHEQLLDMFDLAPDFVDFVDWEELIENNNMIARFDIIPSADGYHFCEFNFGSPIGGCEEGFCHTQYIDQLDLPSNHPKPIPRFEMAEFFKPLIEQKNIDNIVLLSMRSHRFIGYFSLEHFRSELEKVFPNLSVTIHDEVSYPKSLLGPGKGLNTLVYRMFVADDVCENLYFFTSLWQSQATVVNSFESEIRGNKKWLSMFHSARFRQCLDEKELAAIDQYIPETLSLAENELTSFLDAKEDYVFKFENSFGGKGIVFGDQETVEDLKKRIYSTGQQNWSAQKRIVSTQLDVPHTIKGEIQSHHTVLGMIIVGNHHMGMNIKLSRSNRIVNVSSGEALTGWAFPMSEQAKKEIIAALPSKG